MGRPKADVDLAGMTLVDRAVAMLRDAGCEPVVVADAGHDGPLAALVAPLAQLDTEDVVVLACDLPLAGTIVTRLTTNSRAEGQPLCSRWRRVDAADAASRLVSDGVRRMWALVDALRPAPIAVTADELLNVNTPEDLERARTLLLAN